MPDFVINTGPIIALSAACESLGFLEKLYGEIIVPNEVASELKAGGSESPEWMAVSGCKVFTVIEERTEIPPFLNSILDSGEASVIQTALRKRIPIVAIDERLGRRVARLHNLSVTGSIGILVKAVKAGLLTNLNGCFQRMRAHGIWMSEDLENTAYKLLEQSSSEM